MPARATDGYFASGYGIKQSGQGGAESHFLKIVLQPRRIRLVWFLSAIALISA